jgi:hypothetical protein
MAIEIVDLPMKYGDFPSLNMDDVVNMVIFARIFTRGISWLSSRAVSLKGSVRLCVFCAEFSRSKRLSVRGSWIALESQGSREW